MLEHVGYQKYMNRTLRCINVQLALYDMIQQLCKKLHRKKALYSTSVYYDRSQKSFYDNDPPSRGIRCTVTCVFRATGDRSGLIFFIFEATSTALWRLSLLTEP